MSAWVYNGTAWKQIQTMDHAAWEDGLELWVSRVDPIDPEATEFAYVTAFVVPDGVAVTLTQPNASGGPIVAEWTNSTSTLQIDVEWQEDSVQIKLEGPLPAGTFTTQLEEMELTALAGYRARMRYRQGSTFGAWGPWSNTVFYSA